MADNLVICIARQFGSGGREIGLRLAREMDIAFYDKELLTEAAKKSGILQELFEKVDEKPTSSLLYSLSMMSTGAKAPSYADYVGYAPNDRMQGIVSDVIRDVAMKHSCVIIGRCADYILRGQKRMLSVFLHAEMDKRIQRAARQHNLDEDAARSLVRKTDRSRANYYGFFTDRDWGAVDNYDIALDCGRLGIEQCVALIRAAASSL